MAGRPIIYLDNNATTRVDDAVVQAMLPYFSVEYANASSRHTAGSSARAAVDVARDQVARLVGVSPEEVYFTSGATESINLALKGIAEALGARGRHIITAETEHRAVLETCDHLAGAGFEITRVPVDHHGRVDPQSVRSAMRNDTILVTIMAANNEIGTLAPLREIGQICRERETIFHSDATQAVGRIPTNIGELSLDLVSFSAHKMHGPKGAGALVVRSRRGVPKPASQMHGGGHEGGLRSGTLNVPAIVGFGKAAALALERMEEDATHTRRLRDRLVTGICGRIAHVSLNGSETDRLPHTASLTFGDLRADRLLSELRDICASTGSACSSARPEPSHVLRSIGLAREEILSTVRFGLSRFTTIEEIDTAVERIVEVVGHLRERSQALAAERAVRSGLLEGNNHP